MHGLRIALLLLLDFISVIQASETANETVKEIQVAQWKFHEYSTHITIMLFLLVMILIKIAFQYIPYVAEYVPESFMLILVGMIFGAIVHYGIRAGTLDKSVWTLSPDLFFDYLLPPIILESAYSLYNRTFTDNLGVVLLFAVFGTILNFLIIGFLMYGLSQANVFGGYEDRFNLTGFLLFSSLIVAVDPVAVLAIFQDIGVELSLYYIVFGESLLNDAITVVLYEIMSAFAGKDSVSGEQIGLGIASFFTVSFGGLLIGVIVGVISCLLTRIRSRLTAFLILLLAYFSYIMADTIGWSGIISMIGCGLLQAAYAFDNMDYESVITVHKLTKIVSEVTESMIFLFLGIEVLGPNLEWHTGYVLWALTCCLVARAIVTFGLTVLVNIVKVDGKSVSYAEQTIIVYGGLRGAVAFSLAVLVVPGSLGTYGEYHRKVIITATLFIILFTVGVMGITMKPLVKLLHIRMQGKQKLSLFETLMEHVMDETLAGMEELTHTKGRNAVREWFIRMDEKYIRRFLQRKAGGYDHKLLEVYEQIALELHYATMQPDEVNELLSNLPDRLKSDYVSRAMLSGLPQKSITARAFTQLVPESYETGASQGIVKPVDAKEFRNKLRSTRKASMIPKDKRRVDFHAALRAVMRSRDRELRQRRSHSMAPEDAENRVGTPE